MTFPVAQTDSAHCYRFAVGKKKEKERKKEKELMLGKKERFIQPSPNVKWFKS